MSDGFPLPRTISFEALVPPSLNSPGGFPWLQVNGSSEEKDDSPPRVHPESEGAVVELPTHLLHVDILGDFNLLSHDAQTTIMQTLDLGHTVESHTDDEKGTGSSTVDDSEEGRPLGCSKARASACEPSRSHCPYDS